MTQKYINIQEFVDDGYLQEANRLFFHPLGLALEVTMRDDGEAFLSGVWDHRDDDSGLYFGELNEHIHGSKAMNVSLERMRIGKIREKSFGWNIQPVTHNCAPGDIHG